MQTTYSRGRHEDRDRYDERDEEGRFRARSGSRYDEDDDDRGRGRGRGHGGWFGDPEGHSQAARRGWEDDDRGRSPMRGRGRDAEMAQRVVVMYAGRKAEEAPVRALFRRPLHPYTKGLLNSVPKLGASLAPERLPRLAEIRGTVPSLKEEIPGCPFAERCAFATDICRREMPPFEEKEEGHFAACFHSDRVKAA